jgi:hypothetical protein
MQKTNLCLIHNLSFFLYVLLKTQIMDENKNPWKTNSDQIVYQNNWIEVHHQEVTTPAGTPGVYGVVHFKNLAIGIIPLDHQNNTWMVGQFRYPLKKYSWEIPEGGGKIGIDPIESAKRELLEECGILAESWGKPFRNGP